MDKQKTQDNKIGDFLFCKIWDEKKQKICTQFNKKMKVMYKDIIYITSEVYLSGTKKIATKNFLKFVTSDGTFFYDNDTLKNIIETTACFAQISKSTLVNIHKVNMTSQFRFIHCDSDLTFNVKSNYRKAFMEKMNNYYNL